jgi:hypothetical protein
MGVIEEYSEFLHDLLNPWAETSSGECKSLIISSATQKASNASVSRILNKNSTVINQDAITNNKITIDCGPLSTDPFYLQFKDAKYNSSGNIVKGTGCPMFGCCYDVLQASNVKLKSLNENISDHTEEMVNSVSQTIKKSVNLTLGPHSNCSQFIDKSIAETKQISIKNTKNLLETEKDMKVDADQEIIIKAAEPLMCHNKCGESPTAGKVSQAINVDILSKNITSNITNNIQKNYIKQVSKSKTEMTEVSQTKIAVFSIITLCLAIILYIIAWILAGLLGSFLKMDISGWKKHIGAIIILKFFMIDLIINPIVCTISKGFVMECIPCPDFIPLCWFID